mmetsp:Transcript_68392/g.146338  ORF Transcript_68392/g.146338 Transcript_68392/m.146338 type:complete len:220 (+) Transcript_68392:565-1224(+)
MHLLLPDLNLARGTDIVDASSHRPLVITLACGGGLRLQVLRAIVQLRCINVLVLSHFLWRILGHIEEAVVDLVGIATRLKRRERVIVGITIKVSTIATLAAGELLHLHNNIDAVGAIENIDVDVRLQLDVERGQLRLALRVVRIADGVPGLRVEVRGVHGTLRDGAAPIGGGEGVRIVRQNVGSVPLNLEACMARCRADVSQSHSVALDHSPRKSETDC